MCEIQLSTKEETKEHDGEKKRSALAMKERQSNSGVNIAPDKMREPRCRTSQRRCGAPVCTLAFLFRDTASVEQPYGREEGLSKHLPTSFPGSRVTTAEQFPPRCARSG